jgi:LPXTG-site transpeptidase (sortase) family protein
MVLLGMMLLISGAVIVCMILLKNLPSPFDLVNETGMNNIFLRIIVPASYSEGSNNLDSILVITPTVMPEVSFDPENTRGGSDIEISTPGVAPTIMFDERYAPASAQGDSDIVNSTPVAAPTIISDVSDTPESAQGSSDIVNSTPVAAPLVIFDVSDVPESARGVSDSVNPTPATTPIVISDEGDAFESASLPQPVGLIPDRLVISRINLDAPIIPVSYKTIDLGDQVYHQWLTPEEYAVGWHASSSMLGLPGNTVLNGHHNAHGMVFKDLVNLEIGDVVSVYSGSQEFRYQVVANMLLPERFESLSYRMENARWIEPSSDERITLITCWPADSNTYRVVVVALPIGNLNINPVQ